MHLSMESLGLMPVSRHWSIPSAPARCLTSFGSLEKYFCSYTEDESGGVGEGTQEDAKKDQPDQ